MGPSDGQEEVLQLSFGEKAVGLTFNPSGDENVLAIKRLYADIIDRLNILREQAGRDGGAGRHYSVAITDAETAQMRAVKAITWKD